MLKIFLLPALFFTSLLLQGCNQAEADNTKRQNEQSLAQEQCCNSINSDNSLPETEKTLTNAQTVNFKGVSFTYNPQIFSEVTAKEATEVPLLNETDKPDSVMPKHILFTVKLPNTEREGIIEIIPIEDYRRMYAVSNEDVKLFDSQLQIVKKEIRNKNSSKKNDIPILPFWDGHNIFTAKVNQNSFQKGQGIFWLTQWSQDFADLVNNEDLTLMYQGISDNDKFYILADLPVNVSFLPESRDEQEFEGYKLPLYYPEFEKHQKEYKNYIAKITKRLEALPQNKFVPKISEYEQIISSLKIEE